VAVVESGLGPAVELAFAVYGSLAPGAVARHGLLGEQSAAYVAFALAALIGKGILAAIKLGLASVVDNYLIGGTGAR
jgi:ABC-type cobalamin transport system permease subunit